MSPKTPATTTNTPSKASPRNGWEPRFKSRHSQPIRSRPICKLQQRALLHLAREETTRLLAVLIGRNRNMMGRLDLDKN